MNLMNFLIMASESSEATLLVWLLVIPLVLIFGLIVTVVVIQIIKVSKLRKAKKEALDSEEIDTEQQALFFEAFGGADNIVSVERNTGRLTVTVNDVSKVLGENLQALGAEGVLVVENQIKVNFKERAEHIEKLLKGGK